MANHEDGKQLIRSSGSVAANWIEADEALGENDRIYRFKICRKEVKESALWLRLLDVPNTLESERRCLLSETSQLAAIFSSIINKLKRKP